MSTKFFNNTPSNTLFEKQNGTADNMHGFNRILAVVGYFRTSGYFKLRRELGDVSDIRILIGINADDIFLTHNLGWEMLQAPEKAKELYNEQFRQDILDSEYSNEVEEGILQLCLDLAAGRLHLRLHPSKNLHAKFYLCLPENHNPNTDGWVIMGSSNISDSGLGTGKAPRYELNVAMKDFDDVDYCRQEFETLWSEGVPLSIDDIKKPIGGTYLSECQPTPYEIYIKVLIEVFGDQVEEDFNIRLPDGVKEVKFQKDAVIHGYQMLMLHNGLFLSDVVGLGKTMIAAMIAKRYIKDNGKNTRILVVFAHSTMYIDLNLTLMKYDFLIVGAGLYGATFAYLAKKSGKKCLVIDQRPFAGGNLYCEVTDGIAIHKYGAHIFHTSDKAVWNFVNGFVPFNRFTNSPLAIYKGKLYNLPFNMNTFYQLWGVMSPKEAKKKLDEQRGDALRRMEKDGITEPRNLEEQALALVGTDIYEKLIKGYTEKQWGRKCTDLPAFIIRRLPLRLEFDNNYFNDKYQGIPDSTDGYNTLISGLLKDIDVCLGCDFFHKTADKWLMEAKHIIYTGPIDRLLDYEYGTLAYRSVRFETEMLDTPNFQGNAVVNYTGSDVPYTRIIEHKHFNAFGDVVYQNLRTVISREFSAEWVPGTEPFYPVNDDRNNSLYTKYKAKVKTIPYISVAGRLGQYRYFDMDETIAEAMRMAEKLL